MCLQLELYFKSVIQIDYSWQSFQDELKHFIFLPTKKTGPHIHVCL